MDRGAWWAAVYGVAQSWTWLKLLHFHFSLSCIGEGNGNPLQCSCLENPRDGGTWWAAVYGVAQSQPRLKRLSSNVLKVHLSCSLSQNFFQGWIIFSFMNRPYLLYPFILLGTHPCLAVVNNATINLGIDNVIVFVNSIWLELIDVYWFIYCWWLLWCYSGGDCMPPKLKIFTTCPFTEKICQLLKIWSQDLDQVLPWPLSKTFWFSRSQFLICKMK